MKKLTLCLIALVFIALTSSNVFAGKQPDIMFHPDVYKYDIIEGKVTSIDRNTIAIEGNDSELIYNQDTRFYRGDESVAIERVYGGDVFKDCVKITSFEVKEGDYIKARHSHIGDNAILLDTCLIVKK